jgi:hypothetical protein
MFRIAVPRYAKVRFTAGMGFGIQGNYVSSDVQQPGLVKPVEGSGIGWAWLLDAGIQIDIHPIFLEIALFANVHSVTAIETDDSPTQRLFYASPATRGGLRLGVGIPF